MHKVLLSLLVFLFSFTILISYESKIIDSSFFLTRILILILLTVYYGVHF